MGAEFRQFLLRGNVVDLAVGVVIGAAFGAVVTSLVEDVITPLLAAIVQVPDFSGLALTVNGSDIKVGSFLNATIAFVLIAASVFFLIVKPMNTLVARARREPPADPTTKKCAECRSEIPIDARRCDFCAVPVV